MSQRAEGITVIDPSLRFVLFGLECSLGVEFAVREVESVFLESREDQVSAKDYVFFEARGVRVSGHVDEYEPETIWLQVESKTIDPSLIESIVERAKCQTLRLRRDE